MEHPTVFEFNFLVADLFRVVVKTDDPVVEPLRVLQLLRAGLQDNFVRSFRDDVLRYVPHLSESAVEKNDSTLPIGDQNSVRRAFELSSEKRIGKLKAFLDLLSLGSETGEIPANGEGGGNERPGPPGQVS